MTTATLSVYIIAYNEQEKIADAINSVLFADEIIVADSFSTDKTAEIATALGAKVIQVPFKGFGDLRNEALKHCTKDWVFSLDSDERCTPEARDEILQIINDPQAVDVYRVPRRNYFMGRFIKYSGWYPNFRQPQLFRRGKMRYDMLPVHEGYVLQTQQPIGTLRQAIWQFPFKGLAEIQHKANRYSTLGVPKLEAKNVKGSMGKALKRGIWSFIKHYVFKRGFLDGWPGFVIALSNFEGTFYRYAKLYECQQNWHPPTHEPIHRPKKEVS